ncbi:diacylglycerol/lipid kinase family protein [Planctomicrobium sp. SH664]|uniref:diacylglycerol/lipid kinase family protein n=1 Tax=Planctomicrobium sp. SH664 TaxID=3448125 RepID=UPI003F5B0DAE
MSNRDSQQNAMTVIWHPSTASADRAADILPLLQQDSRFHIIETHDHSELERAVERAQRHGNVLVAAGGDGTISAAVQALLRFEQPVPLGVLPLGTGNDFARTLGIPFDSAAAVAALDPERTRWVDVLECRSDSGTRWVTNMITGGNSGKYLEAMNDEMKERWGALAYLRGVVDVLQNMEPFTVRLTCDGQSPETFRVLNLFLANGRMSGGGLQVSPRAEIDDGLADVVLILDGEPVEIASLTADYLLSDYLNHDLIEFRQGRTIRIEGHPPLPLTADGDTIGHTPLDVIVHPQKLRVCTPPPPPENPLQQLLDSFRSHFEPDDRDE